MLPCLSAKVTVDLLDHTSDGPVHPNADYAHHLQAMAIARSAHGPWFKRLLPGKMIAAVGDWLATRRREEALIKAWENSPHLLEDMGVVLTRSTDLPDHLVAAPQRVYEHVAALAPEQIVAAELLYPPQNEAAISTEKTPAQAPALTLARLGTPRIVSAQLAA